MKKFTFILASIAILAMTALSYTYAAGPTGHSDLTKCNSGIPQYLSDCTADIGLGNVLNGSAIASLNVTFTAGQLYTTVAHGLGAKPIEVVITPTSPGNAIFMYSSPDTTNLYLSTTSYNTSSSVTSCTVYFRSNNSVQN